MRLQPDNEVWTLSQQRSVWEEETSLCFEAAFFKALRACLLGRLGRLLAVICARSVSFRRMMSKYLSSNSGLWCIAFNSFKIFGSFCFLVEKKSVSIRKTGMLCLFRTSEMSGVRIRWQYTRARSLFSRDFKISSNSETDSARKLLLLCFDKLLFSTSCQITISVFFSEILAQQILNNFLWVFCVTIQTKARNCKDFFLIGKSFFGGYCIESMVKRACRYNKYHELFYFFFSMKRCC